MVSDDNSTLLQFVLTFFLIFRFNLSFWKINNITPIGRNTTIYKTNKINGDKYFPNICPKLYQSLLGTSNLEGLNIVTSNKMSDINAKNIFK